MQEVRANIKFTTPCLGGIRAEDIDRMLRNDAGQVIFLQAWWKALLSYAAKAANISSAIVNNIRFDPVVDGTITTYTRFYGANEATDFKRHEAFNKDQVVGVNAMLPDGISAEQFHELLQIGGRYIGISPYGHDKGFGRFCVVDIKPSNIKSIA